MPEGDDRAGAAWAGLDSLGMLAATAALPDHIEQALGRPPELNGLMRRAPNCPVVVSGMGGSAVAGAVLQALSDKSGTAPVVLANGYELPAYATEDTLVVAVSFSGDTEETLAAAEQAVRKGCPIFAITAGGRLAELVSEAGPGRAALYRLPGGIPQPRAAVGAMTAPLLLAAEHLGIVRDAGDMLRATITQLRKRSGECLVGAGPAAELARRLGRTFPLVHGARGLGEVAARRFKTQVNENAKSPAFTGAQPEVCHNELCGFGQSGDVTRQLLTIVNMRLGDEPRRIEARYEAFSDIAGEALAGVLDVTGEGDCDLARFFDLVMIGDFASLHMAFADGVDPGPVPALAEVKRRLAEI